MVGNYDQKMQSIIFLNDSWHATHDLWHMTYYTWKNLKFQMVKTKNYNEVFVLLSLHIEQCGTNIIFFGRMNEYIHYHRYWMNEYTNIFGVIKRSRMNIRINKPRKKFTNILVNEYICPKYLNIFDYQIICPTLF